MIRPDYMNRPLWTPEEFADYIGCSAKTILRRADENHGFPRPMRDKRITRFRREDVLEWYQKNASDC